MSDRQKNEPRFDISYNQHGPSLDYHFCRVWEGFGEDGDGVGCYGTNPNHGLSWEEAREEMVEYHQREAERWSKLTLKQWKHGQ